MFPPDFFWGVATSAYQIEGGIALDGRGPSIWDTFGATPGRIRNGDTGAIAADHRRRMSDDVALMAQLGINAYRFSVAWPRVQPDGRGSLSTRGLDFYRSLVDELLERGIEPVVTLYHWDLPQALEDGGGWPARDTAYRLAEYARVMGDAVGDRVRHWSTINEPWCASMLGYSSGIHAPGRTEPAAATAAAHHLLLGHGLAVEALRTVVRADAEIAISLNPYPVVVAGDTDADRDAARRVDGVANRLWYDAVLRGCYPEDVLADFAAVSSLDHIHDGDLDLIAAPIDALGINYYRRHHVRHHPNASTGRGRAMWPGSPDVELVDPPGPRTDGGWAIEPDGLTETLLDVTRRYGPPPLYIHEAGVACNDTLDPDGKVHDQARVTYLEAHLRACHRAMTEGADVRGFFVWSFLDNFEWAHGYAHRFGLVHVDFTTQRRTPKDSAVWYSNAAGGRFAW
jgi:beta-glucosidase